MPKNKLHHDDGDELLRFLPDSDDDHRLTMTTKPTNPVDIQGDGAIVKQRDG